ncbi:ABC transporter substrate-binding protein [Uliginosibacterium sp. sgz301328]|uniref:ABC transporter substrate-binding protein n=1 Tax=Uliginosibacterium sp. sgz301328 TaxID=3243764 RepID=UPI00359CE355
MSKKLLCAAALVAALGAPSAFAADKVKLMLNWYVTGTHAPFYYGKDKGYFEKEGIDLEIQEGRGSGPTIQAVAANNVTFGFADIGTMMKITAKGAPVKAVGVAYQKNPTALIAFSDKKIVKPSDVKGKTVAVTPGDAPSQLWPVFLKKVGLTESDFKTVAGDAKTKVNAVATGQADMLIGFSTDQTNELEYLTKKPTTALLFADNGINVASMSIIANTETLKSNPDLVRRFMRALTVSFEEAAKNPDAAVASTVKLVEKAPPRESLLAGFKSSVDLFHTPDTAGQRPFRVSAKNMADSTEMMIEYGGLDKAANNPSMYYTNEYLP